MCDEQGRHRGVPLGVTDRHGSGSTASSPEARITSAMAEYSSRMPRCDSRAPLGGGGSAAGLPCPENA